VSDPRQPHEDPHEDPHEEPRPVGDGETARPAEGGAQGAGEQVGQARLDALQRGDDVTQPGPGEAMMFLNDYQAPGDEQGRKPEFVGYLAEYDTVDDVVTAARRVRDAGYQAWDVYSPFPIHGIEKAMGMKRTVLPYVTLAGGLLGLVGGLGLVWWINASYVEEVPNFVRGYQYLISGKPIFSLPANIPVIFETTVLLASFAAFLGMLAMNRLPMLYNPLFKSDRFRRVTSDGFFILIDAEDPRFDHEQVKQLLRDGAVGELEAIYD